MPIRLDRRAPDFAERFRAFLSTKREAAADVEAVVRAIIADVAARGDRALIELTRNSTAPISRPRGDGYAEIEFGLRRLRSKGARCAHARARSDRGLSPPAIARDDRFTDALGVELGHRWTAIEAVGLYVPGGTAAYPSSVLMNAVPAKVAGVPRLVMVVPAPEGKLPPLVLAAAKLAGIDEIYRLGGAQAVAALAYGTETIAPVAKIVGPGNAYVAAAKRLVFGKVGIDMIAGPSEVLILADRSGHPDWIAADLLAQAEHDASAQSILITDDAALADAVEEAVATQLEALPRAAIAGASWRDFGAIILVGALDDAVPLVDAIAPEHLEIESEDAERLASPHPQCRRDLPRGPYPGGDRRLCRRLEPRAADRALGPLLVRLGRARLHEAHVDPQMRAGSIACAGAGRDRAGRGRRARCARPLGGHALQSPMTRSERSPKRKSSRLVAVTLDENSIGRSNPDVEHERAVAIYDLLEDNTFAPNDDDGGPYALHLSITGTRLMLDIRRADGAPVMAHLLSLSPLRRMVKDYYTVCDSYYAAIRTATPDRIEALDMARRALHDDGSNILMERLARKVTLDFDTARRLFTLICVLHWKG